MFCPECGSSNKETIGDICIDCFLKNFKPIHIPSNIKVSVCSHCNSKLEKGQWIESNIPTEEIIYRTLERNIELDNRVENEIINLEIEQMKGTTAECTVEINGQLSGKPIQDIIEVNIQIKNSVCPTCSKRTSGYYEAVIQFRADNRQLSDEEKEYADEIVFNSLNKQYKKDKLAYLTDKLKLKEGIDYYIGSLKSAKKVVTALRKNFGGIVKESPRLISEDKSTGKGLYRVWISVRLAEFQVGDFVKYSNKIGQVIFIDNDKGIAIDLKTNENFSLPWNKYDSIKLITEKNNIQTSTLISKSPSMIQILDPLDYSAIDLEITKSAENLNIGDEVELIKIEDEIYLLNNKNIKLNQEH